MLDNVIQAVLIVLVLYEDDLCPSMCATSSAGHCALAVYEDDACMRRWLANR